MNTDQMIGNWEQIKGEAKRQWGKLTDDSFTEIDGDREKLSGNIQNAYGIAKEEADRQVSRWEEDCRKRNSAMAS